MYRLMRFYNQNRRQIIKIILVIVFLFALIQIVGRLQKSKNLAYKNSSKEFKNSLYSNEVVSDKSAVSGEQVSVSKLNSDTKLIDQFINACNNSDLEEAYNLLSDDCKKELYNNLEDFKNMYYATVFKSGFKNYTIENWVKDIYRVNYTDDVMSTGNYSGNSSYKDYITIIKDSNGDYKLNINGFINKNKNNFETTEKNITIKVLEQNEYMNYCTILYEINNKSNNSIMIDDLESLDTFYLEDSEKLKYSPYTNELAKSQMIVEASGKKYLKIKYYKKYSSEKNIKGIVFSKVILNYEAYSMVDKIDYKDYGTLNIKLK